MSTLKKPYRKKKTIYNERNDWENWKKKSLTCLFHFIPESKVKIT